MIVANLTELEIYPVEDRGVPNLERIGILVKESTNLGQYGIMIGNYRGNNSAVPYQDNLFWFGDGIVNKGDWIILYTGSGTPRTDIWEATGGNIYTMHWGRSVTMFANSSIVPLLFRVDAVTVSTPPGDMPQLALA